MDPRQMAQPQLGTPVPGTNGGLPTSVGANTGLNPMAQQLQSHGRGEDSMLVHMTPNEVNSLQGLAVAHGGSLTINPHTGLPEAGWLGKLLPTILGAALAATGVGAPLAALMVGGGQFALTGSLKKGLMAGLGAFGGAGLAGAAGAGGSLLGGNAGGLLSSNAGLAGANMGAGALAPTLTGAATAGSGALASAVAPSVPLALTGATPIATTAAGAASALPTSIAGGVLSNAAPSALTAGSGGLGSLGAAVGAGAPATLTGATQTLGSTAGQFTGGMGSRFAQAVRAGLPEGTPGFVSKLAPKLAGYGVMQGVAGAMTPSGQGGMSGEGAIDNSYQGPYTNQTRQMIATPKVAELTDPAFSGERLWFNRSTPGVFNMQGQQISPGSDTPRGTMLMMPTLNPNAKKGQPMYSFAPQPYMGQQEAEQGYADGGPVHMSAGSFVMPARETAEFGKGSTNAGQRVLAGLGGIPIRGQGDGTSDDIRASIGGQEARVADGEVHFPPEAVRRIGKGSEKRGTDKLYAMMKRAEQSRKQAARGGSGLNVAKGLRAA